MACYFSSLLKPYNNFILETAVAKVYFHYMEESRRTFCYK